jgi:hypothetical protein
LNTMGYKEKKSALEFMKKSQSIIHGNFILSILINVL